MELISHREGQFESILASLQGLPGHIAEFGVYNGESAKQLAAFAPDRLVWAFDTYEGMPAEDFDPLLDHDLPGKFRSVAPPEILFAGFRNIVPVEGRFEITLHEVPRTVKFMFVYMDCDLYRSYQQVLQWLPLKLTPGAVILVDDYPICKGCVKAVHEFCERWGLDFDVRENTILWRGAR